jgi:uncharacterized membrane protein YebE (DUF533 family)
MNAEEKQRDLAYLNETFRIINEKLKSSGSIDLKEVSTINEKLKSSGNIDLKEVSTINEKLKSSGSIDLI